MTKHPHNAPHPHRASLARFIASVLVLGALGLPAAADARHQPSERTLAAVTLGGQTYLRAEVLRRHLIRSGRSWERFLDHRPDVVRAYHLRPAYWRGRTFYSRYGLAPRLNRLGFSYARWAYRNPAGAVRLKRNRTAKVGRRKTVQPTPPSAPAPAPAPEPTAPPTPPPPVFGERMGISLDNAEYKAGAERDSELDETAATGARWVRFDIKWSDVQWSGQSSFNWSKYDPLVDAARARGLNVLANLAYSPTWARPANTSDKYAPDTTEWREAYARFVSAAIARYRGRVSTWEIWNEPNNTMFWHPSPSAASYAALLRHAYPAAKAADPSATILAGATSPASTGNGMIDEVQFIQGVYAFGGRPYFDAWSHHPYDFNLAPGAAHPDSGWWQTYGSSPSIRSVMEANGDGGKKVWATEYGVPSSSFGSLTEATQADRLGQAFTLWRGFAWAGPIFNYMVRDGVSPGNASYWYYLGVTRNDWSRKPAFSVMQRAATS